MDSPVAEAGQAEHVGVVVDRSDEVTCLHEMLVEAATVSKAPRIMRQGSARALRPVTHDLAGWGNAPRWRYQTPR